MALRKFCIAALMGLAGSWLAPNAALAQNEATFDQARREMVETIRLMIELTSEETAIAQLDEPVIDALAQVPRHRFVPPFLAPYAYINRPLPLGAGQNIAQPFIIALMTQLLDLKPGDVVFETGSGAGYHAAVLSHLAARVYSVEIVEPLAAVAAENLRLLGYDTVFTRAGDGYFGWPENGPYDAILIKEAVAQIPKPLSDQLKPGGRLVLPLGPPNGPQLLTVVTKDETGALTGRSVMEVTFSPFQGGERL